MLFSVIYTLDVCEDSDTESLAPPEDQLEPIWTCTESSDNECQLSYLGGSWRYGAHRKWIGLLNRSEFEAFLKHTFLVMDGSEGTSIGSPGFGIYASPALAFSYDDDPSVVSSAFVIPLPTIHTPEQLEDFEREFTNDDWERVKRAMMKLYGRRTMPFGTRKLA